MGTITRRLQRRKQKDVARIVDHVFSLLDQLGDDAYDLDDDTAVADCKQAYFQIADTLTDDGKPTDATEAALRLAVAGPLTRAACRVHPELRTLPLSDPFGVDYEPPPDSSPT